ncbi:hypothetical protein PG993_004288 [Apiospora rasikravindrae]|uniref:Transposase n=1 Tax=Apiospora rasikravindrae TaxID=990691 RepID=A0ABR1TCD5_9PEZI
MGLVLENKWGTGDNAVLGALLDSLNVAIGNSGSDGDTPVKFPGLSPKSRKASNSPTWSRFETQATQATKARPRQHEGQNSHELDPEEGSSAIAIA